MTSSAGSLVYDWQEGEQLWHETLDGIRQLFCCNTGLSQSIWIKWWEGEFKLWLHLVEALKPLLAEARVKARRWLGLIGFGIRLWLFGVLEESRWFILLFALLSDTFYISCPNELLYHLRYEILCHLNDRKVLLYLYSFCMKKILDHFI